MVWQRGSKIEKTMKNGRIKLKETKSESDKEHYFYIEFTRHIYTTIRSHT